MLKLLSGISIPLKASFFRHISIIVQAGNVFPAFLIYRLTYSIDQMNILEELKKVPLLQTVPEKHMQWLAKKGTTINVPEGEQLFKKGSPIDELRIVLQGRMSIYFEQAGQLRLFAAFEKGEVTGLLPYSRLKTAMASAIANEDSIIFNLHKDHFPEMIRDHHDLTAVLVHSMTDRVRDTTRQQQQDDKMMSLGKLSAGLAHELNNPSAAVVRSARELKSHLSNIPENFKRVIKIKATDGVVDIVNDFVFRKIKGSNSTNASLMERTEREDELAQWLEENEIKSAYDLAENFTSYSVEVKELEELKANLRLEDVPAVINWLHQVFTTERLVEEIEEASRRINVLVTSIKSYTHMDQAPEKQRADIHHGIRNTITMLNHKFKKGNVKLLEQFQEDLPKPNIYVSELNQVWTNLIDNALDAMEGRDNNQLEIKTSKDGSFIKISLTDNGPGIPEEIQNKIFDPFFTTKPIGKGTGLGLDVVRQIIAQHNGSIDAESVPGKTEFKVCLPID
jgi:signal transduction histidine kinase